MKDVSEIMVPLYGETVEQLIKKLKQFPGNYVVGYYNEMGYRALNPNRRIDVGHYTNYDLNCESEDVFTDQYDIEKNNLDLPINAIVLD